MRLYEMCEAIDTCPAPVIARVHGYALGGGSGLVACADIAVAAPDAVFGFSEVRLGSFPPSSRRSCCRRSARMRGATS